MTLIEQALLRNGVAHCIAWFELAGDAMVLTLYPWEQPQLQTRAQFAGVNILWVDASYADADASLAWDIIPSTLHRWRRAGGATP